LTSKIQEEQRTCKSGVLMADGGNFSNMKVEALSTSEMAKLLMLAKMLRVKK
jgi:hypothetical protein